MAMAWHKFENQYVVYELQAGNEILSFPVKISCRILFDFVRFWSFAAVSGSFKAGLLIPSVFGYVISVILSTTPQ